MICPFCQKNTPDADHYLVGWEGMADQGTATWECIKTNGRFAQSLCGQAAADIQKAWNNHRPPEPDKLDRVFG